MSFVGFIPLVGRSHSGALMAALGETAGRRKDMAGILTRKSWMQPPNDLVRFKHGLDALEITPVEFAVVAHTEAAPIYVPAHNKILFESVAGCGTYEHGQLCKYVVDIEEDKRSFSERLASSVYSKYPQHHAGLMAAVSEMPSFVLSNNTPSMHAGPHVYLLGGVAGSTLAFGAGEMLGDFLVNAEEQGYDAIPLLTVHDAVLTINPRYVQSRWSRIANANHTQNRMNPMRAIIAFKQNLVTKLVRIPE